MSDIDELYSKKRKYSNLRDNVSYTASYLKKSYDKLNSVSGKVKDGYSIDGVSGDDGYLASTQSKIQSMYGYLNDTVIPSIDRKIRQLSKDIEAAELTNGEGEEEDD